MNLSILNVNSKVVTMTSREIAELTGKEHSHVGRDIEKMLAELGEDAEGYVQTWIHPQNKQEYSEFRLNRELTDVLLTGYSAKLRRIVIARWHELESKQAAPVALSTMDILTLAMESEKGRLTAVAQLAIAAPKVAFVDSYVDATGLKGFRQVAKLLKANEARLREFLADKKIMYRLGGEWAAYQQHIDAGRFDVKAGESSVNKHAFTSTLFTSKGIEWLAGLWAVHGLNGGATT